MCPNIKGPKIGIHKGKIGAKQSKGAVEVKAPKLVNLDKYTKLGNQKLGKLDLFGSGIKIQSTVFQTLEKTFENMSEKTRKKFQGVPTAAQKNTDDVQVSYHPSVLGENGPVFGYNYFMSTAGSSETSISPPDGKKSQELSVVDDKDQPNGDFVGEEDVSALPQAFSQLAEKLAETLEMGPKAGESAEQFVKFMKGYIDILKGSLTKDMRATNDYAANETANGVKIRLYDAKPEIYESDHYTDLSYGGFKIEDYPEVVGELFDGSQHFFHGVDVFKFVKDKYPDRFLVSDTGFGKNSLQIILKDALNGKTGIVLSTKFNGDYVKVGIYQSLKDYVRGRWSEILGEKEKTSYIKGKVNPKGREVKIETGDENNVAVRVRVQSDFGIQATYINGNFVSLTPVGYDKYGMFNVRFHSVPFVPSKDFLGELKLEMGQQMSEFGLTAPPLNEGEQFWYDVTTLETTLQWSVPPSKSLFSFDGVDLERQQKGLYRAGFFNGFGKPKITPMKLKTKFMTIDAFLKNNWSPLAKLPPDSNETIIKAMAVGNDWISAEDPQTLNWLKAFQFISELANKEGGYITKKGFFKIESLLRGVNSEEPQPIFRKNDKFEEITLQQYSPKGSLHLYPRYFEIEGKVEELLAEIALNEKKLHPIELAARVYTEILEILPFERNNRGVAYMTASYVLVKNNFPIPYIKDIPKKNMVSFSIVDGEYEFKKSGKAVGGKKISKFEVLGKPMAEIVYAFCNAIMSHIDVTKDLYNKKVGGTADKNVQKVIKMKGEPKDAALSEMRGYLKKISGIHIDIAELVKDMILNYMGGELVYEGNEVDVILKSIFSLEPAIEKLKQGADDWVKILSEGKKKGVYGMSEHTIKDAQIPLDSLEKAKKYYDEGNKKDAVKELFSGIIEPYLIDPNFFKVVHNEINDIGKNILDNVKKNTKSEIVKDDYIFLMGKLWSLDYKLMLADKMKPKTFETPKKLKLYSKEIEILRESLEEIFQIGSSPLNTGRIKNLLKRLKSIAPSY